MSFKNTLDSIQALKPSIRIIAVTKYAEDSQLLEAYNYGIRDFGENYVIPALKKQERIKTQVSEKINWHLLGPLQSNKVNKAVGNFDWIHSVDSYELAAQINARALKLNLIQKILLQVTYIEDRNGFSEQDLIGKYASIVALKNIHVGGLMVMGMNRNLEKTETIFKLARQLKEVLLALQPSDKFELSMGMSEDYLLAIDSGSTMVRLGRALFQREA